MADFSPVSEGREITLNNNQVLEYRKVGTTPVTSTVVKVSGSVTKGLATGDQFDTSFYRHTAKMGGDPEVVRKGYYFDGSNDYISVADSDDLDLGTGDFTIEFWMKRTDTNSNQGVFFKGSRSSGNTGLSWLLGDDSFGWFYYGNGTIEYKAFDDISCASGVWQHVALTYDGSSLELYVNGELKKTHTVSDIDFGNNSQPLEIGNATNFGSGVFQNNNFYFSGYMSDILISKGVARYTASFDAVVSYKPDTIAGTGIDSYHKLVLSGSLADASNSGHTVTNSGVTLTTPASGSHEGSFYLDGNDWYYINNFPQIGTDDFTIEFWANVSNVAGNTQLGYFSISEASNGLESGTGPYDDGIMIRTGASSVDGCLLVNIDGKYIRTAGSVIQANKWHHIAVSRDSGTVKMFVDGTQVSIADATSGYSGGDFSSVSIMDTNVAIGGYYSTDYLHTGYMTDVRVVVGTAARTASFDLPTSPLTADDTNTKLLFTPNSVVFPQEIKRIANAPVLYNNAKVVRRGYLFDGTNDSITFTMNQSVGTSDFTVEAWVKLDQVKSGEGSGIISMSNSGTNYGFLLRQVATSQWQIIVGDGTISKVINGGTATANVWTHLAVVRNGNYVRLYQDGTEVGTAVDVSSLASSYSFNNVQLGQEVDPSYNRMWLDGMISDVRVTVGEALYTSTFTPPASLAAGSNTKLLLTGGTTDESDSEHSLTFNNGALPTAKYGDSAFEFVNNNDGISFGTKAPDGGTWALDTTKDRTYEFWFYVKDNSSNHNLGGAYYWPGSGNEYGWFFRYATDKTIYYRNIDDAYYNTSVTAEPGQWNHMALVTSGSNVKIFLNGNQGLSQTFTTTPNFPTSTHLFFGGLGQGQNDTMDGYIDNFRFSQYARYTASFDTGSFETFTTDNVYENITTDEDLLVLSKISNQPYTNVSNISTERNEVLLISPSLNAVQADVKDLSLSKHSLTLSGPVINTATTVSGASSIYFDGSNDSLTASDSDDFNFGTDDFTIELWFNSSRNTSSGGQTLIGQGQAGGGSNSSFLIWKNGTGSTIGFYVGSSWAYYIETSTNASTTDEWVHLAAVRSGDTLALYMNGQSAGTTSLSTNYAMNNSAHDLIMGNFPGATPSYFQGYMSNVRITKGEAVYTSAFTPPSRDSMLEKGTKITTTGDLKIGAITMEPTTEPTTPSAGNYVLYQDTPDDENTLVLSHFDGLDNGTVFRDVSRNPAGPYTYTKTGAGTVTDTSQYKFGSSSLYMNRSSSGKLTIDNSSNFLESGADFTIEAWIKIESETSNKVQYIFDQGTASGLSSGLSLYRYGSSYGSVQGKIGAAVYGSSWDPILSDSSLSINEWHHIAFVNQSNTQKLFIDGVQQTTTKSNTYATIAEDFLIGEYRTGAGGVIENYSGWIDEFRISKVARYTSNFDPPSLPFGGGLRMKDSSGKIYAVSLSGSAGE